MCGYICSNCGRCKGGALATRHVRPGRCINCGTLNDPRAKICKDCGAELKNLASANKP